jgi:sec-independent protein translocase protein TatA
MGTFSVWHWLIVLVVVLVLFGGGGKIPKLMRDMGQGINAFKKGLKEEDKVKTKAESTKVIEDESHASSEEKDKVVNG